MQAVEQHYTAWAGNFALGRNDINVQSFGGPIRTLFVAAKELLLEFVKVGK